MLCLLTLVEKVLELTDLFIYLFMANKELLNYQRKCRFLLFFTSLYSLQLCAVSLNVQVSIDTDKVMQEWK